MSRLLNLYRYANSHLDAACYSRTHGLKHAQWTDEAWISLKFGYFASNRPKMDDRSLPQGYVQLRVNPEGKNEWRG